MTTTSKPVTTMLCNKGFIYSAHDCGLPCAVWDKGAARLSDGFVQGMADQMAKNLGGKLVRWWFDNNAGGYFADIEGVL